MTLSSSKPHRANHAVRAALVVVLGAIVALMLAGPAGAITPCGKKVLDDWWDNGRVDRLYPLHCYEEAIDGIPEDIRVYSDAEEVLNRALQAAVGGKLARGGDDPTPGDAGDRTPGAPVAGGGPDPGGGGPVAAPSVDTSGTSSVPIPLLILGGMSLALLAAGALGYVSRRRQAARADEHDEHDLLG